MLNISYILRVLHYNFKKHAPFLSSQIKLILYYMGQSIILNTDTRVFPILCWISWIRWIRWIQQEPVKRDWSLMQASLCLSLTVDNLV